MGKRGPKPTPTAVLKARGSRRADHRGDDLAVPHEKPIPPGWLTADQMSIFEHLADEMARVPGLVTCTDFEALAQLAHAIDEYRKLCREVDLEGHWYTDEDGKIRAHPAVAARQQAWVRCKAGWAQFGLTPADRASLHIKPPDSGELTKPIGLGPVGRIGGAA